MNSLEVSLDNLDHRAFTLIELLLVMGLMFIVGTAMYPIGISFYNAQKVHTVVESLDSALKNSQLQAIAGIGGSSFGVHLQSSSYIAFRGGSYAVRDVTQDEVYPIPYGVSIRGMSDIVFEPFTGNPSASGTFTISNAIGAGYVIVHPSGNIERQ